MSKNKIGALLATLGGLAVALQEVLGAVAALAPPDWAPHVVSAAAFVGMIGTWLLPEPKRKGGPRGGGGISAPPVTHTRRSRLADWLELGPRVAVFVALSLIAGCAGAQKRDTRIGVGNQVVEVGGRVLRAAHADYVRQFEDESDCGEGTQCLARYATAADALDAAKQSLRSLEYSLRATGSNGEILGAIACTVAAVDSALQAVRATGAVPDHAALDLWDAHARTLAVGVCDLSDEPGPPPEPRPPEPTPQPIPAAS